LLRLATSLFANDVGVVVRGSNVCRGYAGKACRCKAPVTAQRQHHKPERVAKAIPTNMH